MQLSLNDYMEVQAEIKAVLDRVPADDRVQVLAGQLGWYILQEEKNEMDTVAALGRAIHALHLTIHDCFGEQGNEDNV